MKEVVPRIEDTLNVTFLLVKTINGFPIGFSIFPPNRHGLIRVFVVVVRFYIPILALENNAEQIGTMVMKKPVIITSQPMVNSYGITKEDECPSYQIRTILISELFRPPDLE